MKTSISLTTYKLLILYMIDVIDYPLSNAQISDFILGRGYTDYFNLQQAISELLESNMIEATIVRHSTRYTLSDTGRDILDVLAVQIPSAMRSDAKKYLMENGYSIHETNSFTMTYKKMENDEYLVHLAVDENHTPLIDFSISVASEDAAKKMCDNWKSCSQELYSHIIATLIK